jgi:thiol-disulfide isomerase/thioredoxin
MKDKLKKYLKEILSFIILFIIVANLISYFRSTDLNQQPLSKTNFTLLDNSQYSIKRDKPILIHFWATWCPVCTLEASNIEYISKHFEVLTIAVNEKSKKDIQNYLKENQLSFQVVDDHNGNIAREFQVNVFPTTFIYDERGKLLFSEVGYTSTLALYLKMLWAH